MIRTSSIRLAESLLLSADTFDNIEIGGSVDDDKRVVRSPSHIKPTIGAKGYLTPNAKEVLT